MRKPVRPISSQFVRTWLTWLHGICLWSRFQPVKDERNCGQWAATHCWAGKDCPLQSCWETGLLWKNLLKQTWPTERLTYAHDISKLFLSSFLPTYQCGKLRQPGSAQTFERRLSFLHGCLGRRFFQTSSQRTRGCWGNC